MTLIVTCEHGGHEIPPEYASLFATAKAKRALASHRGYDPGALTTAQRFAAQDHPLSAPNPPAPLRGEGSRVSCLHTATISRLLIDLNRSLDNEGLFSEFSQRLSSEAKQHLIATHYTPYRERVTSDVRRAIEAGHRVIHVSVHTFTPVFAGQSRGIDIGWLFDPSRKTEVEFCEAWIHEVQSASPKLRLRRNAPYQGTDDGFTTKLRQQFSDGQYAGIELEMSQGISRREKSLEALKELLAVALEAIL